MENRGVHTGVLLDQAAEVFLPAVGVIHRIVIASSGWRPALQLSSGAIVIASRVPVVSRVLLDDLVIGLMIVIIPVKGVLWPVVVILWPITILVLGAIISIVLRKIITLLSYVILGNPGVLGPAVPASTSLERASTSGVTTLWMLRSLLLVLIPLSWLLLGNVLLLWLGLLLRRELLPRRIRLLLLIRRLLREPRRLLWVRRLLREPLRRLLIGRLRLKPWRLLLVRRLLRRVRLPWRVLLRLRLSALLRLRVPLRLVLMSRSWRLRRLRRRCRLASLRWNIRCGRCNGLYRWGCMVLCGCLTGSAGAGLRYIAQNRVR